MYKAERTLIMMHVILQPVRWDVTKSLWLWGVRLNLPELTWLVSGSVTSNHYSFPFHKAMYFGFLHAEGGG